MKEKFMTPAMEVIVLDCKDVIRTSQQVAPEIGEDDTTFEPT